MQVLLADHAMNSAVRNCINYEEMYIVGLLWKDLFGHCQSVNITEVEGLPKSSLDLLGAHIVKQSDYGISTLLRRAILQGARGFAGAMLNADPNVTLSRVDLTCIISSAVGREILRQSLVPHGNFDSLVSYLGASIRQGAEIGTFHQMVCRIQSWKPGYVIHVVKGTEQDIPDLLKVALPHRNSSNLWHIFVRNTTFDHSIGPVESLYERRSGISKSQMTCFILWHSSFTHKTLSGTQFYYTGEVAWKIMLGLAPRNRTVLTSDYDPTLTQLSMKSSCPASISLNETVGVLVAVSQPAFFADDDRAIFIRCLLTESCCANTVPSEADSSDCDSCMHQRAIFSLLRRKGREATFLEGLRFACHPARMPALENNGVLNREWPGREQSPWSLVKYAQIAEFSSPHSTDD